MSWRSPKLPSLHEHSSNSSMDSQQQQMEMARLMPDDESDENSSSSGHRLSSGVSSAAKMSFSSARSGSSLDVPSDSVDPTSDSAVSEEDDHFGRAEAGLLHAIGTDDVDDDDDDLLEEEASVLTGVQELHETATQMPARREEINGEVLFRLEFFTIAIMGADAAADAMFYFSSIQSAEFVAFYRFTELHPLLAHSALTTVMCAFLVLQVALVLLKMWVLGRKHEFETTMTIDWELQMDDATRNEAELQFRHLFYATMTATDWFALLALDVPQLFALAVVTSTLGKVPKPGFLIVPAQLVRVWLYTAKHRKKSDHSYTWRMASYFVGLNVYYGAFLFVGPFLFSPDGPDGAPPDLFVFAILTFAVFAVGMVLVDIEMGNVLQVIVPLFLVVSAVLAVGVVVLDLLDFETLVNIGRFLFIIAGYVIIGSSSAALPQVESEGHSLITAWVNTDSIIRHLFNPCARRRRKRRAVVQTVGGGWWWEHLALGGGRGDSDVSRGHEALWASIDSMARPLPYIARVPVSSTSSDTIQDVVGGASGASGGSVDVRDQSTQRPTSPRSPRSPRKRQRQRTPRGRHGSRDGILSDLEGPEHDQVRHGLEARYKLGRELGRGAFSVVRMATNRSNKRTCAVKSVLKARCDRRSARRLLEEVSVMHQLRGRCHHVVQLRRFYSDPSYCHLVMECCAGGELFPYLVSRRQAVVQLVQLRKRRARETRDAALKAEAAAKAAAGDAPQLPAMQNISSDQAPTAQPATTGAGANSSMMALAARAAAEAREAEAEAEGGTIHDFSCLSEREVRRLMRQMGEAILHCHRLNIVHRDIKPENLLVRHALAAPTPGKAAGMGLSQFAAPIELVIADFGLAQRLQSKKISIVNFCGTVAFMAPEMLRHRPHGCPVDMWALGMVMHLLFTGTFPFPEGQFRQPLRFNEKRWSKISEEGQDVVRRLLEKKASKRMTAQQFMRHAWFDDATRVGDAELVETLVALANFDARTLSRRSV